MESSMKRLLQSYFTPSSSEHTSKTLNDSEAEKVFCIGLNKTGTTTLQRTLTDLGFQFANQRKGEKLLDAWLLRDWHAIAAFAESAEAFQDVPFSLPYTFQAMHSAFPRAKFILSVRANSDEWLGSLTRFHSKLWGDGENPPTFDQLLESNYVEKGYPAKHIEIYGTTKERPYDPVRLKSAYERHNAHARDYFRPFPEHFIELNVAKQEDYTRLCKFLCRMPVAKSFPWLNRTLP